MTSLSSFITHHLIAFHCSIYFRRQVDEIASLQSYNIYYRVASKCTQAANYLVKIHKTFGSGSWKNAIVKKHCIFSIVFAYFNPRKICKPFDEVMKTWLAQEVCCPDMLHPTTSLEWSLRITWKKWFEGDRAGGVGPLRNFAPAAVNSTKCVLSLSWSTLRRKLSI